MPFTSIQFSKRVINYVDFTYHWVFRKIKQKFIRMGGGGVSMVHTYIYIHKTKKYNTVYTKYLLQIHKTGDLEKKIDPCIYMLVYICSFLKFLAARI